MELEMPLVSDTALEDGQNASKARARLPGRRSGHGCGHSDLLPPAQPHQRNDCRAGDAVGGPSGSQRLGKRAGIDCLSAGHAVPQLLLPAANLHTHHCGPEKLDRAVRFLYHCFDDRPSFGSGQTESSRSGGRQKGSQARWRLQPKSDRSQPRSAGDHWPRWQDHGRERRNGNHHGPFAKRADRYRILGLHRRHGEGAARLSIRVPARIRARLPSGHPSPRWPNRPGRVQCLGLPRRVRPGRRRIRGRSRHYRIAARRERDTAARQPASGGG